MFNYLLVILFACASAQYSSVILKDTCYWDLKLDNEYYVKEVLTTEINGRPYDVSIQESTGDIFFARIEVISHNFKLFVLKSGSSTPVEIKGIVGIGRSATVDNDNDIVYLAGNNGIYKYDPSKNKAELVAEEGRDLIHITYANCAIYATRVPGFNVFKLSSKNISVSEPVALDTKNVYGRNLVVDSKENFYYEERTNDLYFFPKGYTEKIRILGIIRKTFTYFAVDRKDNVFVTAGKEIYKVTVDNNIPQHIGGVDFEITAFAFDGRNMILGTYGQLIRYNRVDC